METRKINNISSDIPLAPIATDWGWTTEAENEVLGEDNWDRFAKAHIYYDTSASKEAKSSYKLPVAKMVDGKLAVVFRGVAAAMGALNGARGGIIMPSAERERAYTVLTGLYERFDKEPPELKALGDEIADIFVDRPPLENADELYKMEELAGEDFPILVARALKDLPKKTQTALENKAREHNEDVGDDKRKRTGAGTLAKVYDRGLGAYNTNPESVRPTVTSAQQWAMARVNSFLYVLKNLKFRGGKHDTDLLPKEHPKSSKERSGIITDTEGRYGVYGLDIDADDAIKDILMKQLPKRLDLDYPLYNYPSDTGTLEELDYLVSLSEVPLSPESEQFIKDADKDLVIPFKNFLKEKELSYREVNAGVRKLLRESAILILQLKYYFNRPRPQQVADIEGIRFRQYSSESASTPSYPSGHTIQSNLVAYYLSQRYPMYERSFFNIADKISLSRMQGGMHYYSDIEYGKLIYQTIEDSLRLNQRAEGPTNFPKRGDDKKVSLRNSNHPIFPIDFAERIKNDYPEIWKKGGNIKGNDQYRKLVPIQREHNGVPQGLSDENAIRLREAWVARHYRDFRIAGVIAQIKWLAIGSRGVDYMKDLVREEMKKVDDKKKRSLEEAEPTLKDFRCVSSKRAEEETVYTLEGRQQLNINIRQIAVSNGDMDSERTFKIRGIASSTSVDHYGTEMSRAALEDMARQMQMGVPILPRHHSIRGGQDVAEWDEVIGKTYSASVEPMDDVMAPANGSENQYILMTESKLYQDEELAQRLITRLKRGEPIGQSIGGWFDQVTVVEDNDGEIQRIIVENVVLDHLAITRVPANPDSNGLASLSIRSIINNFKESEMQTDEERMLAELDMPMEMAMEDEDDKEKEDHETGAMKDDEDHIEALEEDEQEDAEDLEGDRMKEMEEMMMEELRLKTLEKMLEEQKEKMKDSGKITGYSEKSAENDLTIKTNPKKEFDKRSFSEQNTNIKSEEEKMKKEDLELIGEMISRSIAAALAPAPEAKPEETVEVRSTESEEIRELKARLAATEANLSKVLEAPIRQGRHGMTIRGGVGTESVMTTMIEEARSEGAPTLANIASKHIETLSEERSASTVPQSKLVDLLTQGLRAAQLDGLLDTKANAWD